MADPTLRPEVPLEFPDEAEHRRQIARRANASFPKDGTEPMEAPLLLFQVTVSDLETSKYAASLWTGALVYVTDETGGATAAQSDGTNWRCIYENAVVR